MRVQLEEGAPLTGDGSPLPAWGRGWLRPREWGCPGHPSPLAPRSSALPFPATGPPSPSCMWSKERGKIFRMQGRPEAHERKKSIPSKDGLRARHCDLCHLISS